MPSKNPSTKVFSFPSWSVVDRADLPPVLRSKHPFKKWSFETPPWRTEGRHHRPWNLTRIPEQTRFILRVESSWCRLSTASIPASTRLFRSPQQLHPVPEQHPPPPPIPRFLPDLGGRTCPVPIILSTGDSRGVWPSSLEARSHSSPQVVIRLLMAWNTLSSRPFSGQT